MIYRLDLTPEEHMVLLRLLAMAAGVLQFHEEMQPSRNPNLQLAAKLSAVNDDLSRRSQPVYDDQLEPLPAGHEETSIGIVNLSRKRRR